MADEKTVPNTEVRISADSHMAEPLDLWTTRMPDKYKDRALQWSGQRMGKGQYRREGGWDPVARLKDMAADGVVAEVLYPTRAKSLLRTDYEPEIAEASARVYNDWLAEFCSEAPDRLWGLGFLPLFNIETAIEEMDRCKQAGMVGINTWLRPPDDLPFSSEHYEKFWSAAEEMDMPIGMHINNGYGPYAEASQTVRSREKDLGPYDTLAFTAGGHKKIAQDTLTHIICSGVLDRHPRLKFIVAEAEVGWIPFFLEELDKRMRRRSTMKELPSTYFYRQVFGTFSDDPVGGHLLSHWGQDSFLWANDYPHPGVGDVWLFSGKLIARDLGHLDASIRAKVVRESVAKLYNMPIPEPMPIPPDSDDPSWEEWRVERAENYANIS